MAIDSDGIGVRVKSDRQGCRLECCLALEDPVGRSPGGRTEEASEKSFHATTNHVDIKECWKEVSYHGCSTCFVSGLIISHRNLVSFDSYATNCVRFPPEAIRSQL